MNLKEVAAAGFFVTREMPTLSCQDMYLPERKEKDMDAQRMRALISAIYDHSDRLWRARNEALHSNNVELNMDMRSEEIAEIRALHSKPHLLGAGDRHYCERSLDKLFKGLASAQHG